MFTKVNFSDIKSFAPETAKWVCNNEEAELLSVKDYDAEGKIDRECLYICDFDAYVNGAAKIIPNAIVVAPDAESAKHIKTKNNLVAVTSQEEMYRITTHILSSLSTLARIGSAGYTLQRLSVGRAPLDNILRYAHDYLENPIALTDASFLVISSNGFDDIADEPQWAYANNNSSFPPEYISNYTEYEADTIADNDDNKPFIDDKEKLELNHRQASVRLSFGGKIVGYLFVLENNRQLTEFDEEFITLVASIATQVIGHNDHKLLLNSSFNEDFLTSILSEAITSPEEILQKQETFGIKLDETLRIIAVDMPLATLDSDKTQTFIRKLRLLFKRNCIVPFENAIVILMDTEDDDFFLSDSDFKAFEDLLNEFNCKANVSAPFHYMYQIRRHYMQAIMCSTLRSMLHIDKPILGYHKEMAEYHMIFNYSMVQNLENLLHPAVIKLRKLDEAHGTDMLNTLFAYANHLCNLTATAKDLYLHYNTLKYRIDKISSITGVNFENSADVHRIVLSQRVMQIQDALNEI